MDTQKSRIVRVGTVTPEGVASGWVMNGGTSGLHVFADGTCTFGGYTVDELRAIADASPGR